MDITPELRKEVDVVFEKFDEFKKRFEANPYAYKQVRFFHIMEDFHAFLNSIENEDLVSMVMHSERYQAYEDFFRRQNDYFMRAVETVEALDIISQNIGVESSLMGLMSTEFLKERYLRKNLMLRPLDFSNAQKFVMVGCGPFPDTVLYAYENTETPQIIGLDNNEEAIYISSQFIESLGFSERIHLECIDGCDYNYGDADVIYIAGFVRPKYKVLEQIAKSSINPDVQILVDSTAGMKRLIFEEITKEQIHPRLRVAAHESTKTAMYRWEMIKLMKYDI